MKMFIQKIQRLTIFLIMIALFSVLGCDMSQDSSGGATANNPSINSSLFVSKAAVPPGPICTNGGVEIQMGIDDDHSGSLEPGEVDETQYVCNGTDGQSGVVVLVSYVAEPAGVHCAAGGYAVQFGPDFDLSGTLEPAEVASTEYVCHGEPTGTNGHNSLTVTSVILPGVDCANGGYKLQSGIDLDDSGSLEPGEITSDRNICHGVDGTDGADGADGLNSLINTTSIGPGANCANGGTMIQTGLDANGNGTLELTEVTSTDYVCGSTSGIVLTLIEDEPVGANCEFAGKRISIGNDIDNNGVLDPAEVTSVAYDCTEEVVFEGDYTISSEDDFEFIKGYTTIKGNLHIQNVSAITNLNKLKSLVKVTGDIFISNNENLENLEGLNNLISVGNNLIIINSPNLQSISQLARLTQVGSINISGTKILSSLVGLENITAINGELRLAYNDSLSTLSGLDNVSTLSGNLSISNNDLLVNVEALSGLTAVGGTLTISSNPQLGTLQGLNNITSVASHISISSCENLMSIDSLSGLTEVQGLLSIYNIGVANLSGLENITTINYDLRIENMPNLVNLDALGNLTKASNITIGNNPSLEQADGLNNIANTSKYGTNIVFKDNASLQYLPAFPNVTTLNHVSILNNDSLLNVNTLNALNDVNCLNIDGNDNITTIGGFAALQITHRNMISYFTPSGGDIKISNNPNLVDLNGFGSLKEIVGDLLIENNDALTNIGSLVTLERVNDNFYVRNNASLLLDDVNDLLGSINSKRKIGGNTDTSGNKVPPSPY